MLSVTLLVGALPATAQAEDYRDRELAEELRQVQKRFPLAARGLAFLEGLHAPGLCNVDETCFRRLQDLCLDDGLPPNFCFTHSRDACCEPLVVLPERPPVRVGFADLTGVQIFDPALAGGGDPGCAAPKPSNIGCTTLCKPCVTFVCEGGDWVPHPIAGPDDELCQSRGPTDPSATSCPRSPQGFCPAECSICY